jgi:UDP-galactopyranose mutase
MIAKIIGCGLSGITSAILLREKGYKVTICDKRNHIGGNCHDSNVAGTLLHNYGPHYFHTNDDEVFNFLSRYTEWFDYRYKPKGNTKMGLISLPYSKKTIKELGRELTQEEIVDVIFKDYSEKQWGVPFDQIPKSITNRIPKTKDDEDPSWFKNEKYQCMPKFGYTKMMEKMLEGFDVVLSVKNEQWKDWSSDLTVYTGKIDEYFNYCYGKLPYRSLIFEHTLTKDKMDVAAINQNTSDVPYTRIYDHSHCMFMHDGPTMITKEYPKQCEDGDVPFYPMPFGEGMEIYNKYKELAEKEKNVIFLGRLATYTYLDMWMAVKQAILKINNLI